MSFSYTENHNLQFQEKVTYLLLPLSPSLHLFCLPSSFLSTFGYNTYLQALFPHHPRSCLIYIPSFYISDTVLLFFAYTSLSFIAPLLPPFPTEYCLALEAPLCDCQFHMEVHGWQALSPSTPLLDYALHQIRGLVLSPMFL